MWGKSKENVRNFGCVWNRPLYLLLSGFARGKLWVAMRLLGPIACRKVCRKTAEITENDQSVVLNRRLPVSTFSPNHWSWRFHLLAPHRAEIDCLASGAERAREIKEKPEAACHRRRWCCRCSCPVGRRDEFAKSWRKQDSRSRNTWNVRKKWSVYLPPRMWECQLKSCALAYSLLRTWKETTISWGIHFWIVCRPVGSSLESVGYWENPQPKVCCERGNLKRQEERERCWWAGSGDPWRQAARWPVWGSGSVGCSRSWHTFLVCRRLVCHSPFKKWSSFLYLRLGQLPPWPPWEDVKASMAECFRANYPDTFIVLDATELCTEICSCLALQSQLNDLIGISPNGSISFVSELWSGSISDHELVIRSVMFCL